MNTTYQSGITGDRKSLKALRIGLCCNTSFAIYNFRADLITRLISIGHRVIVIAPPDETTAKLKLLGADFFPWNLDKRGTGPHSELKAIRSLKVLYEDLDLDVCFNYTIKSILYGSIAGRLTHTQTISVITGLGYAFLHKTPAALVARTLYFFCLRWSREVWFLNADDRSIFFRTRLLSEEMATSVLPGEGIDVAHFSPSIREDAGVGSFRFLLISRMLADKGVRELIQAIRILRPGNHQFSVVVVGSIDNDNPSAIPREEVDAWICEGLITHHGHTNDVRPYIAAADVIVLPSYREGLPRSLLEAGAMSKPVVATDVPGCNSVVEHQVNGLLCEARSPESLSGAMREIMEMPVERRKSMGERGRARVEKNYSNDSVFRHYERCLEKY